MANGLSVDGIVRVNLQLAQLAAQPGNFGLLAVLGDSTVIDVAERKRDYTELDGVAADHGTSSPEYLAARLHFSQVPRPKKITIARWARTATAGLLRGAILNPTQRALANFTAITAGSLKLVVDGTARQVTGLNFSGALNVNGVASILQTAIAAIVAGATVVYDGVQNRFVIASPTIGTASALGFPTAPGSGTDVAALFGFVQSAGAVSVPGVAAEALIDAVLALADKSSEWYGLEIAASVVPSDDDLLAVSAYIEATDRSRLFGHTIQNTSVLDAGNATDFASRAKGLGYRRTVSQYSGSSPHAVASLFGRAFTVNFKANRSTITLKFKNEPGVVAEYLTASQAAALKAKNCNVFAAYRNDTAIIQEGTVANGTFLDEVHGLDWLASEIQTEVYNELRGSTTKIPQTDEGSGRIAAAIARACQRGIDNGLGAPGIWSADGFGELATGDMLPAGFYIYYPPVALQAQSDREARHSVPFQVAFKMAGAVHDVDVTLNINR